MIRYIPFLTLLSCTFAQLANAQPFRTPQAPNRPAQTRPVMPSTLGFGVNSFAFNPTVPASQAQVVRGNFNASTGAFAPAFGGPYALISSGGFEPMRGTFTPSPGGPFVLATREAFNPKTGAFKPSPIGNFVFQTRGTLTPSVGAYNHSASGNFNPATGAFVPAANGVSTLAPFSSHGVFVSSNGSFVPTPMGNFVLTTRQAFDAKTGGFVPSATGTFTSSTRGEFVPSSRFAAAAGIPSVPVNPFGPLNTGITPIDSYYAALMNNPAWFGINPSAAFTTPSPANAAAANPYSNSAYGSYPPYGASAPYASNPYVAPYGNAPSAANYGGGGANAAPATYAPQGASAKQLTPLDAFGIPSENGGVAWPLAFRLMSPDQKRELLDGTETQLAAVAAQAVAGQANSRIVDEVRVNVAKLRQWLRVRQLDLAEGTHADARRFLQRIDDALDTMKKAY